MSKKSAKERRRRKNGGNRKKKDLTRKESWKNSWQQTKKPKNSNSIN